MNLAHLKSLVDEVENQLEDRAVVFLYRFERDGHPLNLALTSHLRNRCRKDHVWKSKEFLSTLKNAEYGFDSESPRSRGGRDGIFLLDRAHKPSNEMMKKLFNHFIDRKPEQLEAIARELFTRIEDLRPVRLVSHNLRLLGVLYRAPAEDWLVLVDCDKS